MEENFAEQIVPGTFIRVQAEGLIAPKGVSFGNVGIVGTAAAATGVTDAIGQTHILGSMEDAAKLYAPSDALSAGTQNLMRGLALLFAGLYLLGLRSLGSLDAISAAAVPGRPSINSCQ